MSEIIDGAIDPFTAIINNYQNTSKKTDYEKPERLLTDQEIEEQAQTKLQKNSNEFADKNYIAWCVKNGYEVSADELKNPDNIKFYQKQEDK